MEAIGHRECACRELTSRSRGRAGHHSLSSEDVVERVQVEHCLSISVPTHNDYMYKRSRVEQVKFRINTIDRTTTNRPLP
jgi:hypothetical protein